MSSEKTVFDIETTKLEDWNLLVGSHEFPGKDGGTCINEAAIIARGFEYREVTSYEDLPPCFSKVIGQFALYVNDELDNSARNKFLSSFICRLPGTKDRIKVERRRARFIIESCLSEKDIDYSSYTVDDLNGELDRFDIEWRTLSLQKYNRLIKKLIANKIPDQLFLQNDLNVDLKHPAQAIADTECEVQRFIRRNSPEVVIDILDKAILMGKHESVANIEIINQRMRDYKNKGMLKSRTSRKR